jgi:hypothetical protein
MIMSPDQVTTTTTSSTASYLFGALSTILWRSTQLALGLGAILATLLYFKQESLLYFPEIGGLPRKPEGNPRRYRSPAEHQIHFEDVQIPCEDGVNIHAWLMLRTAGQQANPLPTFVYFHGNAGNIGLRLPNALQMMQYLNVNVLLVEYRGYGNSDSVAPTEAGLKLDGQAALKFIVKHPKINPSKIFLFGRSLGGAVAFDLANYAQQRGIPIAGVIVENTFTSISAMVDHLMPFVAPLKGLVLRMKWDSSVIVPTLQCPVLYLAGAADQLVPHSHMVGLYQSTKQSKHVHMHVVPNGTHNETWMQGGQDYWLAIKAFLVAAIQANNNNNNSSKLPTAVDTTTDAAASNQRTAAAATTTKDGTGSGGAASSSSSTSSSSIPIMSNNLFGMVKEAVKGGSVDPKKGPAAAAATTTSEESGKKEL